MGTDIHTVAQVYKEGKWQTVATCINDDIRHYETFAILAGVRGDMEPICGPRGFPDDFEVCGGPFDESKNYHPLNPLYTLRLFFNNFWMGEHDFSWLLLSDLKDHLANYPCIKTTRGCISEEDYLALRDRGVIPTSWMSEKEVSDDPMLVCLRKVTYDLLEKEFDLPTSDVQVYVKCSWDSNPVRDETTIPGIIEHLETIATEHCVKDEEVRLVFGFDS